MIRSCEKWTADPAERGAGARVEKGGGDRSLKAAKRLPAEAGALAGLDGVGWVAMEGDACIIGEK